MPIEHLRPGLAALIVCIAFPLVCAAGLVSCAPTDRTSDRDGISIRQGVVGTVGGSRIGIFSIDRRQIDFAPGSPVGNVAHVDLETYGSGIPTEFDLFLREGNLIPTADGMHRVKRISTRSNTILISAAAVAPPAASGAITAYLARSGSLRLNGPQTDGATDMRISAWGSNARTASADVEWGRASLDSPVTGRAHLTVGKRLKIGRVLLAVSAIEPMTADHPAWICFTVSNAD